MTLLLIIMQTIGFYSSQSNKNKERQKNAEHRGLDVIIKNNSSNAYYFNRINIENPSCVMRYVDDSQRIKEFYFSPKPNDGDVTNDMTMFPSSFSYRLNSSDEIKLHIELKQGFDEYYKVTVDESNFMVVETLIGTSFENHFYMYCSTEMFSYSSLASYSTGYKKYGRKLEGKRIDEHTIEFTID